MCAVCCELFLFASMGALTCLRVRCSTPERTTPLQGSFGLRDEWFDFLERAG